MRSTLVFLAALPVVLARPAPVAEDTNTNVEGKFIITLKPDAKVPGLDKHLKWVDSILSVNLTRRDNLGLGVEKIWNEDMLAYSGKFDKDTIDEISKSDKVLDVEPVQKVELFGTIDDRATQKKATWGLGSISHRKPGFTEYLYDESAGENTYAYVIDTGVNAKHVEFEGRASNAYNAVPNTPSGDYVGHGTHCAGTIAARTYGVAKKAKILAVKVVHESSTTTDVVLDGFHWAVNDILRKRRAANSVISMSLGGIKSAAFNNAVNAAWKSGIVIVAAAGNSNKNAGDVSPASATNVIAVGAIDKTNRRAKFSNYGSTIDIFAPGVAIVSTGIESNTAILSMSGTSMACPHVAGVSLYLKAKEGALSPDATAKRIRSLSTKNVIYNKGSGSPNVLLYNGGD